MPDIDVLIVGAGVVGLAIAAKTAKSGKSPIIIDKNTNFGEEISSRNSEVIHAGMYYPTNSLKAKLCVRGNELIYDFCKARAIMASPISKLILATNSSEIPKLEKIYNASAGAARAGDFPRLRLGAGLVLSAPRDAPSRRAGALRGRLSSGELPRGRPVHGEAWCSPRRVLRAERDRPRRDARGGERARRVQVPRLRGGACVALEEGLRAHVRVVSPEAPLGETRAVLDVSPGQGAGPTSVWSSRDDLRAALVECYDAFGVDPGGYVYVLTIDRDPWREVFARPLAVSVPWMERGPLAGARLDSALHIPKPCRYRWRPLRRERLG